MKLYVDEDSEDGQLAASWAIAVLPSSIAQSAYNAQTL